ncbi:hypothetical protein V1511DRAFT_459224 [Dipodascopsis uninucleata]
MITSYFSEVLVRVNPFLKGKTGRVFISRIPPKVRPTIKLQTEFLNNGSEKKPLIQVKFKDGKVIEVDPTTMSIVDVVQELDRHSRALLLKDQIES